MSEHYGWHNLVNEQAGFRSKFIDICITILMYAKDAFILECKLSLIVVPICAMIMYAMWLAQ